MDLYRIADPDEFEMIGGRELLFSGGVSVIEWAEKIKTYLPESTINVYIEIYEDGKRNITVSGIE